VIIVALRHAAQSQRSPPTTPSTMRLVSIERTAPSVS